LIFFVCVDIEKPRKQLKKNLTIEMIKDGGQK